MKITKNENDIKNTKERDEILYQEKIINYWDNEFWNILKNKEKITLDLFPIDNN